MKKSIIGSVITVIIGAAVTVAFLIAIGMDYRHQEDRGIEPGYTPDALLSGFDAGLWIVGIGLGALIVCSIVALARRRRGPTSRSAASH
jgi:hypothetical protein